MVAAGFADGPITGGHVVDGRGIAEDVSRQGKFAMSLHGSARTRWSACRTPRPTHQSLRTQERL